MLSEKTKEAFLSFNPMLRAELMEKFPELKEIQPTKKRPKIHRPERAVSFKEINNFLNCEEVAGYLGLGLKRNFCKCPFHNEKTASMKIYKDGYYCFGCQASGDSIDLASKVLNVKPIEAVANLNEYFGLGYDLKKKASASLTRGRKTEARKNELYNSWYQEALSLLSDYIRICYYVMNAKTLEESLKEYGRQEAERVEYIQDEMFTLSPVEAYTNYKKVVMEIDKRIKYASGIGSRD